EVLKPGKQALHLPSSPVARQLAGVLRLLPLRPVGRYQLGAVLLSQLRVEPVAIVGLVADQLVGRERDVRGIERLLNELHFVGRSACCANGDRKTMAVCNCHDLRPLPALCFPNVRTPFFALANVPSMKHSRTSMPPRSNRSSARACRIFVKTPAFCHFWNQRWQVGYGGKCEGRSFQRAPVWRIQRIPLRTGRGCKAGRPLPSARRTGTGIRGSRRAHCASVSSMPTISAGRQAVLLGFRYRFKARRCLYPQTNSLLHQWALCSLAGCSRQRQEEQQWLLRHLSRV